MIEKNLNYSEFPEVWDLLMSKFERDHNDYSSENIMHFIEGLLDAGYTKDSDVLKVAVLQRKESSKTDVLSVIQIRNLMLRWYPEDQ